MRLFRVHNGQGGIGNPEERGDARAKIKIRKVGVRNQLLIEILKNSPSPRKLKKKKKSLVMLQEACL